MKKVVLSLLLLLICVGSVYSQFDAQLSQYMFHNSSFNPAAVGEDEMIQTTFQHRWQWSGMPNAGKTFVLSINSPLKFKNTNHGVGLIFLKDEVGLFLNNTLHLQYAYKKKINEGILSLGADIGFVSLGFRSDSVNIPISDYHSNSDVDLQIPSENVSGMSFDLGLGAFYSTPKLYAGISYLHLNKPVINWNDLTEFKQNSSLFVTGGYNWLLPDTKYVFKPSTLFKTDFSTLQLDVTARMEYDNKYWGGLSYRIQDAVVFLAGINISGGFSLGYSYDLPTSKIITVSSGSHEILFFYSFEYVFGKRTSKYKSIRIL